MVSLCRGVRVGFSFGGVPGQEAPEGDVLDHHAFSEDFGLHRTVSLRRMEGAQDGAPTSYILKSPECTLCQCCTPVAIECSCDECSWNGPDLTWCIRMIDRKYRFVGGSGGRSTADTAISF